MLKGVDGILVPGDSVPRRGGKVAPSGTPENRIPYFGICLGMQWRSWSSPGTCAAWQSHEQGARQRERVPGDRPDAESAPSRRRGDDAPRRVPVQSPREVARAESVRRGSGLRAAPHRYEFNNEYGLRSGERDADHRRVADDRLVEIVEIPDHPWFLGCQFHPEFVRAPWSAPLFRDFIGAAAVRPARGRSLGRGGERVIRRVSIANRFEVGPDAVLFSSPGRASRVRGARPVRRRLPRGSRRPAPPRRGVQGVVRQGEPLLPGLVPRSGRAEGLRILAKVRERYGLRSPPTSTTPARRARSPPGSTCSRSGVPVRQTTCWSRRARPAWL